MKSRFLFAAAAAVALGMTSCSQDDVVEQSSFAKEKAITFGTYLSNAPETRGIVTTTTNLEEFGVTAYSTGQDGYDGWTHAAPNFMYNQKVTKVGSAWEYSPIKYWPTMKDAKVSFFAHAPYDSEYAKLSLASYSGRPYVDVTIADETEDMIDFVAGEVIDKTTAANNTNSNESTDAEDKVSFIMKHKMTRLSFTAQLDEDLAEDKQTTVVIKSIVLDAGTNKNIFAKKGTFTFANETTTGNTEYWTLKDPVQIVNMDKYLDFNKNKTYSNKTYSGYTIGLYGSQKVNLVDQSDVDEGNNADDQYIFFLPVGTAGAGVQGAMIHVEYDIVTADNNLLTGYSCTESKKTFTIAQNTILAKGMPYNFHLTFNVDQVELSLTEVAGWGNLTTVNATYTYGEDNKSE